MSEPWNTVLALVLASLMGGCVGAIVALKAMKGSMDDVREAGDAYREATDRYISELCKMLNTFQEDPDDAS